MTNGVPTNPKAGVGLVAARKRPRAAQARAMIALAHTSTAAATDRARARSEARTPLTLSTGRGVSAAFVVVSDFLEKIADKEEPAHDTHDPKRERKV